jgi:hypothetical protein
MEKKRGRVITGWRQVGHGKTGLSKPRFSAVQRGKTELQPRVAVAEKAANEAWDTEGGHFAEPAKHPVEPPTHPAQPVKRPVEPEK